VTAPRRRPAPAAIDERAFHAWLARALPSGRQGPLPLGDDAAAVPLVAGSVAVVSTDSLVEGTHFRKNSPPRLIGRAASGVSLSDIAAKGATPLAVFLAIVVPPGSPRSWAQALVLGAEQEASRFGAHVLGGDTKPGPIRAVVSTVVGSVRPAAVVGRTGARPGDLVVTTGVVGRGGAAALALRSHGPAGAKAVSEMLRVRPRVREGRALARYATAMLDTSDGLAESARLLAGASHVALVVDERCLPICPALTAIRSRQRRRAAAFYGGDYELLATVPAARMADSGRAVRRAGGRLTAIGVVRAGRGAWLLGRHGEEPMPPAGWRPFAPTNRRRRRR